MRLIPLVIFIASAATGVVQNHRGHGSLHRKPKYYYIAVVRGPTSDHAAKALFAHHIGVGADTDLGSTEIFVLWRDIRRAKRILGADARRLHYNLYLARPPYKEQPY